MKQQINKKEVMDNVAGVLGYPTEEKPEVDTSVVNLVSDVSGKKFSDLVRSASSATTGDATIMTTSSTRDTYLTSASMAIAKDATCDVASGAVVLECTTAGGSVKSFLRMAILTLTAQNSVVTISFPVPLKLDRGTNVIISGNTTHTAGLYMKSASLVGFEMDKN